MYLIWYNSDLKRYEHGSNQEYEKKMAISSFPEGFNVLYKFNKPSVAMAEKITDRLNYARIEVTDVANLS